MSAQIISFPAAKKWLPALLLATAVAGCNSDSESRPQPPVRSTAQGPVQGVEEDTMLTFKGIPYAAPPVGNLRFEPPAAPASRGDTVLQATEFGSPCPQKSTSPFVQASTNEDCLYLNVYSPKAGDNHPVMVWIHGGAFVTGSGGAAYNPGRLVEQDVVVVTINYRLGPIGFLAHESLRNEAGGSGDYGIMDQQAALAWVKSNIDNFGGDPTNVTIFGESAGGHSVLTHLVSPASAGLFDKVIVQSGSYAPGGLTQADAEARGANFVAAVGCADAADIPVCLRALDIETILDNGTAVISSGLRPNMRRDIYPTSIGQALNAGTFNRVPVMMGTNLDEYRLWTAYIAPVADGTYYQRAAALGASQAVADAYLAANQNDPNLAVGAIGTDVVFACNALGQARDAGALVPTYFYEFADRDAPPILPSEPAIDPGAAHAFEIQYVLSSEESLRERGATDDQVALANAMVQYWTAFARTGDPGQGSAGTNWPAFVTGSAENMISLVAPTPADLTASTFDTTHNCTQYWPFLL